MRDKLDFAVAAFPNDHPLDVITYVGAEWSRRRSASVESAESVESAKSPARPLETFPTEA